MNMKNCKGTQPLSTSERSFNFHAIFLVFTLTSNTVAPHIRTVAPPLGGGGGGMEGDLHRSRVSDLLVNVQDTEYLIISFK